VIQLAQTFGLEAVAEGVESRAEAERLRALGYEYAQGFHFARPASAEDMIRVIEGSALATGPIAS
jgi:EAL domain-containing protein (putative c-di-GMP-specific phosphodiesterase class I)